MKPSAPFVPDGMVSAENVVFGVAVDNGRDSGWKIVASSLKALSPEMSDQLVTQTNVGLNQLEGGSGYFGRLTDKGASWAVICSYEKSKVKAARGTPFVQRNIALVAWDDFVADVDAHAIDLFPLPPTQTFSNLENVKTIDRMRLHVAERTPPGPWLGDDVLRLLLTAFFQPTPTVIVWAEPDLGTLRWLLSFFPPSLRAAITWCTCVSDVTAAKTTRLKIVSKLAVEEASIFRFETGQFVQQRISSTLAPNLVPALLHASKEGLKVLADLHFYIEQFTGTGDYLQMLEAANAATVRWRRRVEIGSLTGAAFLQKILEHARDLPTHNADDERSWLLTETMTRIDPGDPEVRQRLRELSLATDFSAKDFQGAGIQVAERVAGGDLKTIQRFLECFESLGRWRETIRDYFFAALPQALEQGKRNWQFVEDLATNVRDVPLGFFETALETWAFQPLPGSAQLRKFFDLTALFSDLDSMNATLRKQIEANEWGRVAFALLIAKQKGILTDRLPAVAAEASGKALLAVVTTKPRDYFDWPPLLYLRFAMAAYAKDPHAFLRSAAKTLGEEIIGRVGEIDETVLTGGEADSLNKLCTDLVHQNEELAPLLRFIRARQKIVATKTGLGAVFDELLGAVEQRRGDLERLLATDGGDPLLWWSVMAAWYQRKEFEPSRALSIMHRTSFLFAARGARCLLSIAMMSPGWGKREQQTVAACTELLKDVGASSALTNVELGDAGQLAVATAAATLFAGRLKRAAQEALESTLPPSARLRTWSESLESLNRSLAELARTGPVMAVSSAVGQVPVGDLMSLRSAIESLVQTLKRGGALGGSELIGALNRGIRDVEERINDVPRRK